MTRQRAWQLRQRKKGLCIICPMKAVTHYLCEKHRLAYNKLQRARRSKKP